MQLGIMTHPTMVLRTTRGSVLAELRVATVLPSSRAPVIAPTAIIPYAAKLFALPLAHGNPFTTLVRMLTRAITEINGTVFVMFLQVHFTFPITTLCTLRLQWVVRAGR